MTAPSAPEGGTRPVRKSKRVITCTCGKEFTDEAKHHRHLHEAHPEHSH